MMFQEHLAKTIMVTIELDDERAEKFKRFSQHEQEIMAEHAKWRELKTYVKQMQFGSFTLTVKDGMPYRVDKPIQTLILGIKI